MELGENKDVSTLNLDFLRLARSFAADSSSFLVGSESTNFSGWPSVSRRSLSWDPVDLVCSRLCPDLEDRDESSEGLLALLDERDDLLKGMVVGGRGREMVGWWAKQVGSTQATGYATARRVWKGQDVKGS